MKTKISLQKYQKYMVPAAVVFALLIFALAVLYGKGVFLKKGTEKRAVSLPQPETEIDFSVLESEILKGLEPFEKIPPFEGTVGRDNPFLPY